MGGTSSSNRQDYNKSSFKNSVNDININITNSGPQSISQASNILKFSSWDNTISSGRRLADDSGHECGPGRSGNSKDQDTVDDLRGYVNSSNTGKTDILQLKAKGFYDNVNKEDGNFQKEVRRINEFIKNYDDDTSNRKFDTNRNRTEIRIKLNDIYNTRISEYNQHIKKLEADLNELNRIKGIMLTMLHGDVKSDISNLNNYKNALDKNIKLNEKTLDNLKNRIDTTKEISVSNYEQLYNAIILQNDTLKSSLDETSNKIVHFNRHANLISDKKDYINKIYFYLLVGYFIILIGFLIFLIFFEPNWSLYYKILIFIIFLLYPFYIYNLELFLYNAWNFMISILFGSVFNYSNNLI